MDARRQGGFTATEMMIVVAIVGLLTAIAAPSLSTMVKVQRLRTAAFDIVAGLTLARSEALKRNSPVTITPTGASWASGWTSKDANGNIVQQQGPFNCSSCTLTGPTTVTYSASGRLPVGATPPQFAITSPDVDSTKYRCVDVDLSGRPVTKTGAC